LGLRRPPIPRQAGSAPAQAAVAAGRLKRTRAPASPSPASSSTIQMRPPWASTIAREMARPQAAAAVAARGAIGALLEGLEDPLAVGRRDARAGVGDLDLDARAGARGADGDAAVGRVWRIAFWMRSKSTRWMRSGLACAGTSDGSISAYAAGLAEVRHTARFP
jgi:hypothetical protein